MSPERRVCVQLLEEESVVARGTEKSTWYVRSGGDWHPLSQQPETEIRRLSSPPGTVWRRELLAEVPVGALLARVTRRPPPHEQRDVLAVMKAQAPPKSNRWTRVLYRVDRRGTLTRATMPD